jgi:16S rRNA (uracil1498-N3)-methyltransferase
MHRFFVPPELLSADPVRLDGSQAHQLARVLRVAVGERIELLDNSGWAFEVVLERVTPTEALGRVVRRYRPESEPSVRVVLCQGLPKHRKFDLILQKGTELGVARFVPLLTRYSDVRETPRAEEGKRARWERIVQEAAEQSGRAVLPEIAPLTPFADICVPPKQGVLSLMGHAREGVKPLREALRAAGPGPWAEVRLGVGPEGGLSDDEVTLAHEAGIRIVSLGPRVLRTETAAIAALAILLYELDTPAD